MCDCAVLNGTHYPMKTPGPVLRVLEDLRQSGRRVRVHYGDCNTGRDWMDEYNVTGTIGRSCGSCKIPLMVHNCRSLGGSGILTNCIVRIRTTDGQELYRHPSYHQPVTSIIRSDRLDFAEAVTLDGEIHARFRKSGQAARWCRKMGLAVPA